MEEQHLIIYIHINNIHVFTVTFDQCNVSFLNRVIKLLKRKKKILTRSFLNSLVFHLIIIGR